MNGAPVHRWPGVTAVASLAIERFRFAGIGEF